MLATSIQLGRKLDFIVVNNESTNNENTVVIDFFYKFCFCLISGARIKFESQKKQRRKILALIFSKMPEPKNFKLL